MKIPDAVANFNVNIDLSENPDTVANVIKDYVKSPGII